MRQRACPTHCRGTLVVGLAEDAVDPSDERGGILVVVLSAAVVGNAIFAMLEQTCSQMVAHAMKHASAMVGWDERGKRKIS